MTETTSYLIKQRNDEVVIQIPSDWKITFAAVNPASTMGNREDHCVRVYEMPGSKLRAVFDSVISIRDMSIPLARAVKHEVGNRQWTSDSTGNFSETSEVKVDHQLVAEVAPPFEG